jgi:hypothetical protein
MEAPALKLNGVYHIKRDEEAGRDAIGTLGRNRRKRRHCERSEAIHGQNEEWIASSLRSSQ